MARIKQLPESVANQISAGEVVERPASVVKELVENSIDAGSDKIAIETENGGKDKIRVRDNGSGIEADELELAFSRYATSKIKEINDLYSIKTLGFRGEALASIASVSRIEIRTRTEKELKGSYMKIAGGKIISKKPAGVPRGTDIIVEDLFYNTPARFKYLKTTNTEFGHISNIVNREALAYPEIQFSLRHNNNQVLQTPGSGDLLDALYAIYGEELVSNLLAVDYEDRYIKLEGFIARPDYYRSSRVYQLFFVNRRTVYNRILSMGVEEGYRGLLPPNTHPVVFLNLKLNQILVDVNVHPTKREIKFSRDEIIKDVIIKGIRATLESIDPAPRMQIKSRFDRKKNRLKEGLKKSKVRLPLKEDIAAPGKVESKEDNSANKMTAAQDKIPEDIIYIRDKSINPGEKERGKEKGNAKGENSQDRIREEKDQTNEKNYVQVKNVPAGSPLKKILGRIHNTYIIAEAEDGMYIIDQHNAHERVLYDQFKNKFKNNRVVSQPLLVPATVEVTLPEMEVINKYRDDLEKLGIKMESFGGKSLIVQEVPAIIKRKATKKVIRELIDNLLKEGKTMNQAELIDEMITYMACRGAIKAGMKMEEEEVNKLINDLFQSTNPNRCPHGRPIIIHLTEKDIEKGMGRR
ncbi:MAG: mismatch repair protein MutL [Halanaerobiales bacterium]|nr:mismatch repair protein MutL [Halanaerobiales bacterium]